MKKPKKRTKEESIRSTQNETKGALKRLKKERLEEDKKGKEGVSEKMVLLDEKEIKLKRMIRYQLRYQISQLSTSFGQYYVANRLFLKNKSLWYYLTVPGIISFLHLSIMLLIGYLSFGELSYYIYTQLTLFISAKKFQGMWFITWIPGITQWDEWIFTHIQNVIYIGLWILMCIVIVTTYKAVVLSVFSSFMAELSSKVENLVLYGTVPENKSTSDLSIEGYLLPVRNSLKEFLIIAFFWLLCVIIPGLTFFSPLVTFLISSYYSGINLMSYALERRKFTPSQKIEYHRNNWGMVVGAGAGFLILMVIPIVGWAIAPSFGTAVGTLVIVNAEKKKIS